MLKQQKELFLLEEGITYLNGAAYSPLLKSVVEAGKESLLIKTNPHNIIPRDLFFNKVDVLREMMATLIHATDKNEIAIQPAVSYGMAVVAKNLHRWPAIHTKKDILIIQDEFPNNVYTFERVCTELSLKLKTVCFPDSIEDYNDTILATINDETALVVIPHVHWINGYTFDLAAISKKCKAHQAMLVIDGTQSLGILPFDLSVIQANAVIGCSYKWMMGPYSHAFAYFDSFFDDGIPLEESWMNRVESDDFAGLLDYKRDYRPKAQRYNVGEFSHFIQTPMAIAGVQQILNWGVENLQEYCKTITKKPIEKLESLGCSIIKDQCRAGHLFSIQVPAKVNISNMFKEIQFKKISVSLRGESIRISSHVYNSEEDLFRLVRVIADSI